MLRLTPLALLVTAGVVAVPIVEERRVGVAAWAAAAFVVGFAFEAAGVATGLVFGRYAYGPVLGPKLFGVPLVIGLNWPLVVLGAVTLAMRFVDNAPAAAVVAGALSAGFDRVLEPFAVSAGYWAWQSDSIPVQNSVAWFLIASLIAWAFTWRRLFVRSPLPSVAIAIQLLFFILLRILAA